MNKNNEIFFSENGDRFIEVLIKEGEMRCALVCERLEEAEKLDDWIKQRRTEGFKTEQYVEWLNQKEEI